MRYEKILGTCTDFGRNRLFDDQYTLRHEGTGDLTLFADRALGWHTVHVTDNELQLQIACGYVERSEQTYDVIEAYQNYAELADVNIFIKKILGRDALFLSLRLCALPDDDTAKRELEHLYSDYFDAYRRHEGFLRLAGSLVDRVVPKERYETAGTSHFDRRRLYYDLYENLLAPIWHQKADEIRRQARQNREGDGTSPAPAVTATPIGNAPSAARPAAATKAPAPAHKPPAAPAKPAPYCESEDFLEEMADFRYTVSEGVVTLTSLKKAYTEHLSHGPFAAMGDAAPVCLTIPRGVHKLAPRALAGEKAQAVNWLYLLYDVSVIGTAACAEQKELTKLELRAPVTVVGERAFAGTGLESVRLPDSTERILKGAFADCAALHLAYVPAGCAVAKDAFPAHTEVVRDIEVYKAKAAAPVQTAPVQTASVQATPAPTPKTTVPAIPKTKPPAEAEPLPIPTASAVDVRSRYFEQAMQSFRYRLSGDGAVVMGCRNAYAQTAVPEGVTEIGGGAFAYTDTKSVERITLPSTLRVLGANAFKGNFPALREIVFAENGVMETLPDGAFGGLNARHTVTVKLPPSVKQVADGAFRDFRCTLGTLELHVSADCRINEGALPRFSTVKRY